MMVAANVAVNTMYMAAMSVVIFKLHEIKARRSSGTITYVSEFTYTFYSIRLDYFI